MDLVWKNRASLCDVGAVEIRGGRPKRGFKFVQGGASSKRKAGDRSRNRHSSSDSANDQLEESTTSNPYSHSYDLEASTVSEADIPMLSNSLDNRDTFEVIGLEVVPVRQEFLPAPSSILFNDLAHKMEPVLNMCETSEI